MTKRLFVAVAASLAASGCFAPRAFVAPALPTDPKASAAELKPGDGVVALDFTFTTNGKPNARATEAVRPLIVSHMKALGVARVAAGPAEPVACTLRIHMDNIADAGAAWGKGFKTGFTFGVAGSTVDDGYQFDVTVEQAGQAPVQRSYRHLITSALGNASGPPGVPEMTLDQAVNKVIDDLLVTLLRDLQGQGILAPAPAPAG